MSAPEFSRPLTLAEAGRQGRVLTVEATAEECAAVAARFDLLALDTLEGQLSFMVEGPRITISGSLHAVATQRCVATQQPLPITVDAPLHVILVPAAQLEADGEEAEIELEDGALDIMGYTDGHFDVGDVLAETLALALPLFPRSPDADAWLKACGVQSEGEAGRFGGLAALRDQLAAQQAAKQKGEE